MRTPAPPPDLEAIFALQLRATGILLMSRNMSFIRFGSGASISVGLTLRWRSRSTAERESCAENT